MKIRINGKTYGYGVRYGDANTALTLTDKAEAVYSGSDPQDIYEMEDGSYIIDGATGFHAGLTADEVNELLEELADELAEQEDDE